MSLTLYRYDGSFEGLLSAFAEASAHHDRAPDFGVPGNPGDGLLFGGRDVPVRPEAAAHWLRTLTAAGGEQAPRTLAQAFLAELPGCERPMYEYCLLTLERGECVDDWAAHPAVKRVCDAARRVGRELHRFKGLLRFAETTQGVYYAPCEPDHNITLPLGRYFAGRLRDQRWIIHDRRRDIAVLWDGETLQPGTVPAAGAPGGGPTLSPTEALAQEHWRTYHGHIAIDGRSNPRLQRQCMPRRYWRYLTEMQG